MAATFGGGVGALDDEALKQRLLEDSLARDRVLAELEKQPLKIVQTSGSSAGAGSGDFHHYRQYRRAEFSRLGAIEREHRKEQEKAEFERRRLEYEEECARETAKKSSKRKRKKEAAKARKAAKTRPESDDDVGPQMIPKIERQPESAEQAQISESEVVGRSGENPQDDAKRQETLERGVERPSDVEEN